MERAGHGDFDHPFHPMNLSYEFLTEANMFLFFSTRKWLLWAWLGSAMILSSLWVQVKIDVMINDLSLIHI